MELPEARPEVGHLIKNLAEEHGIRSYTITRVKTNGKGEGFLGEIITLTIQDTTSDKKLEVVIKASFNDIKIRTVVPIKQCFQNEVHFYSTIYPTFKKLEQDRGILDLAEFIPRCYKTFMENECELLAIEDLNIEKFEVFPKTETFDKDHVELVFKTYGRLHAYSFALQDQKREEYAQLASKLHNIFQLFLKSSQMRYRQTVNGFAKSVEKCLIPGEDDEIITKFEKYKGEGIGNCFVDCVTRECEYPVVLHGDSWSNNMMFKYETSKLTDLRLIDFQLTRLGSPIYDLSYCLYSGGSKTIYDNLDHYLNVYHESLSFFLTRLGSDAAELFPFKVVKEQWKKHCKWGMIMGVAIWKLKTANREDIQDYTDIGKEKREIRGNDDVYSRRVKDILYHMSEIDAL